MKIFRLVYLKVTGMSTSEKLWSLTHKKRKPVALVQKDTLYYPPSSPENSDNEIDKKENNEMEGEESEKETLKKRPVEEISKPDDEPTQKRKKKLDSPMFQKRLSSVYFKEYLVVPEDENCICLHCKTVIS